MPLAIEAGAVIKDSLVELAEFGSFKLDLEFISAMDRQTVSSKEKRSPASGSVSVFLIYPPRRNATCNGRYLSWKSSSIRKPNAFAINR
ncbi:Uncharacterised protein [Ewingella americana]|uniref:Uncharacterized protein n=1 Tax=Ewingella americana TaxID=41202 RepID=A0A377N4I5_9GAMM|nr:Uncharacterised protein [Ewingella americana]